MKRSIILGFATVLAACSSQMPAVRVAGDPISINRLAGEWEGEYWGASSGRRGTLAFSLRAGTDSLVGDVLMVDQLGGMLSPADNVNEHRLHMRGARGLRIDFVAVNAIRIRGTLEPYISPDCDCTVTTTFYGDLKGDEIDGTFDTHIRTSLVAHGFWKATRKR